MDGSEESFDLHVKLLMLGDTGVGKTCLLLKYVQNSFSPTFITTIGIDFKIKIVSAPHFSFPHSSLWPGRSISME
jgi:Ras-related protein Rab-8A